MLIFVFCQYTVIILFCVFVIADEVQTAMKGELATREKRIATYVEKYQK